MKDGLRQHSVTIDYIPHDKIGNDCKSTSKKFLGMHIDENLTWKNHVRKLLKRCQEHSFP